MKEKKTTGKRNLREGEIEGKLLHEALDFIRANDLSSAQVRKLFSKKVCERLFAKEKDIPLSIFDNDKLSALEAVVKYLKEVLGLKLKEIASLLNRNSKTIWTTYNNASKKMPEIIHVENINLRMPISLFKDRDSGPLEVVVHYLKDELGFKNKDIANLLHRDQRTIWATYNRKN